jgi:hypothetical protein
MESGIAAEYRSLNGIFFGELLLLALEISVFVKKETLGHDER